MKNYDLMPEQTISLIANIKGEQLSFNSKILEVYPKKKFVLAEPVFRDEKVVTFRTPDLTLDVLVYGKEEQPSLFQDVSIILMKKSDNTLCYSLTTNAESKKFNRRQNYRCFIGNTVSMQCGLSRKTYEVILRDISVSGFAVVCPSDVELELNQVIHVVHMDYLEEANENHTYHLYGLVVRKEELPNGRIVYGCRLNSPVMGLGNYISTKQRLQLKRTNGGNL